MPAHLDRAHHRPAGPGSITPPLGRSGRGPRRCKRPRPRITSDRDGQRSDGGAVAGLVAMTPAAGYVAPVGGIVIGLVAGAVCALAVGLKFRFGFDDSLDVVGIYLVGGRSARCWSACSPRPA